MGTGHGPGRGLHHLRLPPLPRPRRLRPIRLLASLTAIDRWTVGYALVVGAIGWRRPPHTAWLVPAQLCVLALAFLAPWALQAGRFGGFVAEFYPLIIDYFLHMLPPPDGG